MDIVIAEPPVQTGLDIVSLEEMKQHLSIRHSQFDDRIIAAVQEAAEMGHGLDGELNRTIFPMTWIRYLPGFPSSGIIKLPYPPLIEVLGIYYDLGESPPSVVSPDNYTVRRNEGISVVEFHSGWSAPTLSSAPRAVSVTFRAGYTEYPHLIKRYVKTWAAQLFEFPGPVMTETRQITNRAVEFGLNSLKAKLVVPHAYDDWL